MIDPPPPAARAALAEAAHAHASLQSPDSRVASPRSGSHSDTAASAVATLSPASTRRADAAREAAAREGSVERLYVPPLMPVRAVLVRVGVRVGRRRLVTFPLHPASPTIVLFERCRRSAQLGGLLDPVECVT